MKPLSISILFTFTLIGLLLTSSDSQSPPQYSQLSARTLGLGTAMTAVSGDEQCLFFNPAGLANIRRFRIGQSHSLRHFPGEKINLDQLDADPVALIYPLKFAGVFGAGFVLQGELGYDYLIRNDTDFPQRRLWGTERYDAYAGYITPWTKFGMYHRSNIFHGKSADDEIDLTAEKQGEGGCFGIIQTILPGLDYGYCSEKMDSDYLDGKGETVKRIRTGWSIKPLPWIHYATDKENIKIKTRHGEVTNISTEKRKNWGIEIAVTPWTIVRWGRINGKPTSGLSLGCRQFMLHYGEAKNMMPWIVGDDYPDKFKDIHLASYSIEF